MSQRNGTVQCLSVSATALAFWATVFCPLMTQANDDWARFRGPTGQGTAETSNLPTTWNAEENVAWKTPLPGAGASSPIVYGDRVYLTYYDGYFVPGEEGGTLLLVQVDETVAQGSAMMNRHHGMVIKLVVQAE